MFQRTPSSIDVRDNRPTDPAWAATLQPGWQQRADPQLQRRALGRPPGGGPRRRRLDDPGREDDGDLPQRPGGALDRPFEEVLELANFEKMEEIRRRVDAEVDDPAVGEALKPYYKMFCKRPCFHDEYLATFNRPNVTLVDTDGRGVDRITTEGVVAGGVLLSRRLHHLRHRVRGRHRLRAPCRLPDPRPGRAHPHREVGRAGHAHPPRDAHPRLSPTSSSWAQSQGAWTANFTQLLDEATLHLAAIVEHLEARGLWSVEATAEAEDAWADEIVAHAVNGTGGIGGSDCTPGYYNNEGRPLDGPPWGASYGKGSIEFFRRTAAWRRVGVLGRRDVRDSLTWPGAVRTPLTGGPRARLSCGHPRRQVRVMRIPRSERRAA